MLIPGSCYWNRGFGRDKGEVLKDEEADNTMALLGENMTWLIKKTASQDTEVRELPSDFPVV